MIHYLDRTNAIKLINEYGSRSLPFLFMIDFELQRPIVLPLKHIDPSTLLYDINGQHNVHNQGSMLDATTTIYKSPISFSDYQKGFDYVVEQEKAGNSYLANLTYPTPVSTHLTLKEIFLQSKARYRIWWDKHFVVFSPESFVTISQEGQIASFPMKGTIDASIPNAADQLLNDQKEKAEHATIVDLIRNDLSIVANQVQVSRYRYLEEITTSQGGLLQTSSEITGQLPKGFRKELGDIIFQLLPAGSISGAPKRKTIEIIQQAEHGDRGYYTGVCGIFDGKKLDSGVMIRFIEDTPKGLLFRSGGGITAQSEARSEYQEMIRKVYLPLIPQSVSVCI